jgi:hypothetical protein
VSGPAAAAAGSPGGGSNPSARRARSPALLGSPHLEAARCGHSALPPPRTPQCTPGSARGHGAEPSGSYESSAADSEAWPCQHHCTRK